MLGVTYKFSYEPDDYRFVNLEIVEYEPESVETFPTIKDTDVNNISAFTNAGIELPCCVHFINSSLWFDFVDDLVYVRNVGNELIAATMDNALVYFSIDERSGRLSMYKAYNLNERIDLLGEQLDNIQLTPGPKGKDGVTFTPSVSEEGILSWTNDGELQNPQSVNIKGPVGQQGVQGEQGIEGPSGQNGVSPTVEVAEIDGGHRVSITDVNGTQTFDVMNGQNISAPSANSSEVINAPIGSIMAWSGDADSIPQGWHICDGEDGTVDLRGKFILGADLRTDEEGNAIHPIEETGGSEEVTLTGSQMPSHTHPIRITGTANTSVNTMEILNASGTSGKSYNTSVFLDLKGSSEPHPNMPPYIALIFIQKISASPSDYVTEERVDEKIEEALANQNGSDNSDGVPSGFIGMWSGAIVPNGWALCDGTNGTPDLRGRFVLGNSENHAMGETGGSEEVTLTIDQMPTHTHKYIMADSNIGVSTSSNYTAKRDVKWSLTDPAGGDEPHPNMPPYYVLAYIMKL